MNLYIKSRIGLCEDKKMRKKGKRIRSCEYSVKVNEERERKGKLYTKEMNELGRKFKNVIVSLRKKRRKEKKQL